MRQKKVASALAVMCMLLAGCGEFAYKRGAGVAELGDAQKACKAHDEDRPAFEKCMGERGWMVQKLDELNPVAIASVSQGNRGATTVPEAAGKGEQVTSQTSAHKPSANPLDVYTISSWWKMGGKPEGLKLAMDACVEKLGDAHRPAPGSRLATRGLLHCLREQGWQGLQGK